MPEVVSSGEVASVNVTLDRDPAVEVESTAGPQGVPGRSVLLGTGAPSNAVGSVGDVYFDVTDAHVIAGYGPKGVGGWPVEPFVTADPDTTVAQINTLIAAALAPVEAGLATSLATKVDKTYYSTVQHIADNPADVPGLDQGFDEGAAVVVDDIAYWISGGNWGSDSWYLPYILRYDLATDEWLSSVQIPAPAGMSSPTGLIVPWTRQITDVAGVPDLGINQRVVAVMDVPVAEMPTDYDYAFFVGVTDLPSFASGAWIAGLFFYDDNVVGAQFGTSQFLGSGIVNPANMTSFNGSIVAGHRLAIVIGQSAGDAVPDSDITLLEGTNIRFGYDPNAFADTLGWGFEGGYYGAIGTKLYFGGGDSNLYDDGSGPADGGGFGPWSSSLGRQLMSYDTVTHSFDTLPVKPNGSDYCGFGVADGKLYVVGNVSGVGGFFVDVFDPVLGHWTSAHTDAAIGFSDWAQGVQVGRFLYWPDMGFKLNLDADPTTNAAWVAVPTPFVAPDGSPLSDDDAAAAVGRDGVLHMFGNTAIGDGSTTFIGGHAALDPVTDTWTRDDAIGCGRYYFSAVEGPSGWRFIGGGTDVQGEVHPADTFLTEHADSVMMNSVRALLSGKHSKGVYLGVATAAGNGGGAGVDTYSVESGGIPDQLVSGSAVAVPPGLYLVFVEAAKTGSSGDEADKTFQVVLSADSHLYPSTHAPIAAAQPNNHATLTTILSHEGFSGFTAAVFNYGAAAHDFWARIYVTQLIAYEDVV